MERRESIHNMPDEHGNERNIGSTENPHEREKIDGSQKIKRWRRLTMPPRRKVAAIATLIALAAGSAAAASILLSKNDGPSRSTTSSEQTFTPPANEQRATLEPSPTMSTPQSDTTEEDFAESESAPSEGGEGFQKKEVLPDGSVKYFFDSQREGRPNIRIVKENESLFSRSVTPKELPTRASSFTNAYGSPEKIIVGSSFYGPQAETYIYATRGIAFIVDPQTGLVLEQLFFPSTDADRFDEYVNRLGIDN